MSVVRKIKPKKVIPKPKPIKLNSNLKESLTNINDIPLFKMVLSKIIKANVGPGVIGVSGSDSTKVDFKIDNNIGFKISESNSLKLITTKFLTAHSELLINRIEKAYTFYMAKSLLEQEGYSIKERETGEQIIIEGARDNNGVEQSIEISTEIDNLQHKDEETEKITIHSKNFDDAQDCEKAVENISKTLGEETIDNYLTHEYSGRGIRKKSTKAKTERRMQNKTASKSKGRFSS